LFAVFVDFKGAFDNVRHEKLWPHLQVNKVSSKIILSKYLIRSKRFHKLTTWS
jgi:hypothetical protein